jgi:putative flippase GtrA
MRKLINKINNLIVFRNVTFIQAIKYFFVGGCCTILDFVLLYILTRYLNVNYIASSIISFMSGAVLNYILCVIWIFEIRIIEKKHHEFIYYLIITGIGLGLNTLIIWGFTELLCLYFMFSKLLASSVTYWWNFGARKYFLHTVK